MEKNTKIDLSALNDKQQDAVSVSAKLCAILVRKQSQNVSDLSNFSVEIYELIFTQSL